MPTRQAVRIVIQCLGDANRYRLIVYGDAALYRPLEFASRDAIFSALRHLVPESNESVLPAQDKALISRIVFSADVNVSESQLRNAGVISS